MAIAVPVAIGVALFITQYAPRRLARPFAYLVDLLAAVPSIVYGLWGVYRPAPVRHAGAGRAGLGCSGWIPLFGTQNASPARSSSRRVVLAIMILPIVTAISREVFAQTPAAHKEARPRPRRHPLGDDPHRGPALRPRRRHLRRRCSASAGLSARPSRSASSSASTRGDLLVVALLRRRDLRLADRQQRRGVRHPARRPAPSSPPVSCSSCSRSPSTPSPASSSSAGRPSRNEHSHVDRHRAGPRPRRGPAGAEHAAGCCATASPRSASGPRLRPRRRPAGLDPLDRRRPRAGTCCSRPNWWTNSQRGITPRPGRRRRLPRDLRHPRAGRRVRGHRGADRRLHRDLPRRVRPRPARPGGELHGRHPHRDPVDRRGAVHLRPVGHDARVAAGRRSRSRCRSSCS